MVAIKIFLLSILLLIIFNLTKKVVLKFKSKVKIDKDVHIAQTMHKLYTWRELRCNNAHKQIIIKPQFPKDTKVYI